MEPENTNPTTPEEKNCENCGDNCVCDKEAETPTAGNVSEVNFQKEDQDGPLTNAAPETPVGPSKQEEKKPLTPAEMIDMATEQFARNVYGSFDYKGMFEILGQPEKYPLFEQYIEEHVVDAATGELKLAEGEKPRMWSSFFDDKPVSAPMVANIIEALHNSIVSISIGAARVVDGSIYDSVIGPQIAASRSQDERFAAALGNLQRRVERLENPSEKGPDEIPNPTE